jgi:serine/threonine protein kinase
VIPIFKDIFKGFFYLASKGFLHRDLKPANIFIKDNVYKIADFGFAKKDNGSLKK